MKRFSRIIVRKRLVLPWSINLSNCLMAQHLFTIASAASNSAFKASNTSLPIHNIHVHAMILVQETNGIRLITKSLFIRSKRFHKSGPQLAHHQSDVMAVRAICPSL